MLIKTPRIAIQTVHLLHNCPMFYLPQARKLPYITPQLHTDSLKNKDVILAAPCYHAKLPDSRRAEGLFRSYSDGEDELQRRCVILALSCLRDFGQQSSPTHTSWLLSGGIASAIFILMKSEETHKQPKADHISCFLTPLFNNSQ